MQEIIKENKSILKRGGVLLLLVIFVVSITLKFYIKKDKKWYENNYLVAHAFGSIDNITYTNSLEAFQHNYLLGHRVFEVDFSITSDKKVVLRHGWSNIFEGESYDKEGVPTRQQFVNSKLLNKYTQLSFEDLIQLMYKYKDIYIITDSKETKYEKIKEEFSQMISDVKKLGKEEVLDRLIIQIYNDEMLLALKEVYDFKNIIYTLYAKGYGDWEQLGEFCNKNNIPIVTMWADWWNDEICNIMNYYGIKVYGHTVNNIETTEQLFQKGLWGIYTDDIIPNDIQKGF